MTHVAPTDPAAVLAAEMMDEPASIGLFIALTVAIGVAAASFLPLLFQRLPIRLAIPALAVIGPVLAVIGSLIGSGAMTLSGNDIGYVVLVASITGLAAIIVGWRLSRPLARDLGTISETVGSIAAGNRQVRTGIARSDEVGELAARVDALGDSLQRAEAEREAADDERGAVVSALSHDLRTPLASLLASVDALEDGMADGPTHLRSMRHNVLALERLVEDLFLLARADSGSLALQAEPLDLAELIDEAIDAVAPAAAERRVRLVGDLSEAIPVTGDDHALGRVLRNLLDNAVRHSPDDAVVRVAATRRGAKPAMGETVVVTVRDDGPGFAPDFAPRALDRFSQADAARSRQGGAGLGLAIADTLVEAHGGSVTVQPGPGGLVSIELPLS